MKQIGENDKCTFYRTDRCTELEGMPAYIKKYGEGIRMIRVEFKNPAERNEYFTDYLIINKDGEAIGEITERTAKGQEALLQRLVYEVGLNGHR